MEKGAAPALFVEKCIIESLHGVREGLTKFSGKSRIGVIFSLTETSDYYIFDPQNLFGDHAPKLRDFYYNSSSKSCAAELNGLISYCSRSPSIQYQVWYTEHHPDLCSTKPTEYWLAHVTDCVTQDLTAQPELYTGISGNFLREYAIHAIRAYLKDQIANDLGEDIHFPAFNILNSILGIASTFEEGAKAQGKIIFVEPKKVLPQILFLAKFDEEQQPLIANYKHVRKLLQAVEDSDNCLVSDGKRILGVASSEIPPNTIEANFHGKIGFLLYNNDTICSFADGAYKANSHKARMVEVEEILLDYPLDTETRAGLFKIIEALVHNAQDSGFGCSLVIDLHNSPRQISGQSFNPPLDLQQFPKLNFASKLAKVDGALHIRSDLKLHGFACLMDGYRIPQENKARGARYNSALRFSFHNPKTIVIVVSSDRPVSIIHRGLEYTGSQYATLKDSCMLRPQPLEEWLKEKEPD